MKVFVSHSSQDRWVASRVAREIGDLGAETFLDEKDIETGDSISAAVAKNLKDSDEFVVLVTPHSVSSEWVLAEIGGALILEKRVVPIVMHLSKNELPKLVRDNLARDINDIEKYYAELSNRIAGGRPSVGTRRPARQRPRISRSYEVGDRVRINPTAAAKRRTDLAVDWDLDLEPYVGLEADVMVVDTDRTLQLDVDDPDLWWAFDWLEPA